MQLKVIALSLLTPFAVLSCSINHNGKDVERLDSSEAVTAENRIIAVLMDQQSAWNAGDIDDFMQGYWQSPDLRFASGGTVTRGWQKTRDRYHARYSDRSIMGELTFDQLEVTLIDDKAAVVHGAWALQRAEDRPSGLFTLIFNRIDGDWKIISDTTTSGN
ncbi:MAG: nuclear transport factor 2 family protein [Pseudomonadota bacterium]